MASKSHSGTASPKHGRPARRVSPKKTLDVDEKDFLDMMMAEVNEDEAAEVLGEAQENPWSQPEGDDDGSVPES